ncbi:hypothetical protein H8356DRAFT_1089610 [Neocallimastix lanati (nom. inval.)]|uniref:Uncharacterized protein n=1 Tax=Neocallimastix californiae TaxID=1754190 RepID=A0A1Y1ZTU5_9FUNG|nr:hypothetical protein H8356DRAFT_1089610 [Neocallimastix sp. JGI-2020a]ORY13661.1 hypothetical protein LY90DRAFT_518159 [Neocallimastix californiae]|eukprot:ORY13661.1 hypothetical protein LY90DRAFT_518159 [Neocallimastix californiae]
MAVNQTQQHEIKCLGKLAWETQRECLSVDKTYYHPTSPIPTRSAMEDVVMTDAYPMEYERDIPMFNVETEDVESFIDRLKIDNNNHNGSKDDGTRQSERQNYYKNFYTSSNNPILKTVLLMLNGSEYKEFVPEAKISNFRTQEELKNLNVLYNTGLQINMIHPQLAKEMGFKIEDRPLMLITSAGKELIPQGSEEFKIKVKLVEESTGKVK